MCKGAWLKLIKNFCGAPVIIVHLRRFITNLSLTACCFQISQRSMSADLVIAALVSADMASTDMAIIFFETSDIDIIFKNTNTNLAIIR